MSINQISPAPPKKTAIIGIAMIVALLFTLSFITIMQVTAAPTATTRYVVPNGSNSGGNDCSNSSNPCRTVAYAVDQSVADDIIQLAAGTYPANIDIYRNLTFNGAGVGQTILDGGNSDRVLFMAANTAVTLTNLSIRNGDGGVGGGGGIQNLGALTLDKVEIYDNYGRLGGGIYNDGTLTMTHSSLHHNTVETSGGGMISWGTATIQNSAIHDNSGGGIHNTTSAGSGGILTLTNVTVSGNISNTAVSNSGGGTTTLLNVTIANNSFNAVDNSDGTVLFKNTLIANNGLPQCLGAGTFTSQGNNLESSNICNFNQPGDQVSANPHLMPLGNYGGATKTHMMYKGSSAIDGGAAAGCPATDQRGNGRPLDGDGNGTAVCDIGAIEFNPASDGKTYVFLPSITK